MVDRAAAVGREAAPHGYEPGVLNFLLGYPIATRPMPNRLLPPASLTGCWTGAGWAGLLDAEERGAGRGAGFDPFARDRGGGLDGEGGPLVEDLAMLSETAPRDCLSAPRAAGPELLRLTNASIDVCVLPDGSVEGPGRAFSEGALVRAGPADTTASDGSRFRTSLDGESGRWGLLTVVIGSGLDGI